MLLRLATLGLHGRPASTAFARLSPRAAADSLFITYRLSKAPLHAYRTTLKFLAVKLLVFVSPAQRHALGFVLGVPAGDWAAHVATAAETPLLTLLLWRAFPATELPAVASRKRHAQHSGSPASPIAAASDDDEASRLI